MATMIEFEGDVYGFVNEKNGYKAYRKVKGNNVIRPKPEVKPKQTQAKANKKKKKGEKPELRPNGKPKGKEIVIDERGKIVSTNIKEFWAGL